MAAGRDRGTARARRGELHVPQQLAGPLLAVLGLDDRPQAAERYRIVPAADRAVSYTPLQLASAYDFPDGDGAGHTIAIIELGGGFTQTDLDRYFAGLGLATPSVTAAPSPSATP